MTTVFVAPGAASFSQYGESGFASVKAAFGGPQALLTQLGDNSTATVVEVPYRDWDSMLGHIDCAAQIDAKIHSVPATEQKVVIGHSFGAVGICQWLRQYAPASTIDPAKITFVLAANSIRLSNGYATMLGLYGPGNGPVTSKYTVHDAARQFDRWADFPNVNTSPFYWQAYSICNAGDNASSSPGGVPSNIHNSYQNVRLNDPNASKVTIGDVTFYLFETDPVPIISQKVSRGQVETAYNRIVHPDW